MSNLFWSGFCFMLVLSGCGFDGTPTRNNDFTPLTSIEIINTGPSTIAAGTSTVLTVQGDFSGQFTDDVTDQAVWSSDTPAVAAFVTASSPNRVTAIAPGTATLTATVQGLSATIKLTVSDATVTALSITPVAPSVPKGLTTQFAVSGTFSDGSTQPPLTFDVAWSSSDAAVATVSDDPASKGLATGLAIGTATISATFKGVSSTTLLTVTEPVLQSITVSSATTSVLSLSTASFQATGHFSDGSTPDLTSQVAWTSSRPDLATIASGGAATTLAQGTTAISATLNGVSGATNLKVTGGNLSGFLLVPTIATMVKGTVVRMTATGTFVNGVTTTTRDISGVVVYTPSNAALATVDKPGGNLALLNALDVTPSPTTVTATIGSLNIPATVTVTAPDPVRLDVAIPPTNLPALTAGTSARFTATATFNDVITPRQDVTASATWRSSNPAIASVGDSGVDKGRVRGVAAGTAIITASYVGVSGVVFTVDVTVAVIARTLQGLIISGATPVAPGNQVPFTATANYVGISPLDVTEDAAWSIDNPNVAILADSTNQPGQVVGVDSGQATLTAVFRGITQTATITVP